MLHYSKVAVGLRRYLHEDLVIPHKGTGKAWLIGAVIELVMMRVDRIFRGVSDIPLIKLSGYVNGDDVDVDALYAAFSQQAKDGNAVINIPGLGPREYTEQDVDKVYRYIKEA